MKSKQSYTFEHEGVQTAPTKIPKFEVKYAKKQKPTSTSVAVQTGEGQTLGEAPANVYTMSTYSPLTQQINIPASESLPALISPGSSYHTAESPSTAQSLPPSPAPGAVPILLKPSPIVDSPISFPGSLFNTPTLYPSLSEYSPVKPVNVWNGEGIPVFEKPLPIITNDLPPRPRPPPGFYNEQSPV